MLLVVLSLPTGPSLRVFVRARHKPGAEAAQRLYAGGKAARYAGRSGPLEGAGAIRADEERRGDQLALGERAARRVPGLDGRRDFADLRQDVLVMRGDQPCVHVRPNLLGLQRTVKRKIGWFGTTIVQKVGAA